MSYSAIGTGQISFDPPDAPAREIMEFTLVYWDTTLKAASTNNKRSWEKHQIRLALSEQLENLWKVNPSLHSEDPLGQIQDGLAQNYERCGVGFIPLVLEKWCLVCTLDITLLRPGVAGRIVSPVGDLDNQIKVLLDALRLPKDKGEMQLSPGEVNPSRIYCLLEDDKLITSIRVSSSQLLVSKTAQPSEACILLRVKVSSTNVGSSPWAFGLA
ncbi:MAG TPA: hypothetical protein VMI32_19100 [Candidatus Solibacter sp.]|nr:hypothetical protein [Candidatus Solibacter sp.]